ncbi:MAG: hypothetical protein COA71_01695 [SAR86 cluster bacterium]|uniref:FHA domain-containing protein n=1 Tax=SAR86 cluster bacterium TaxID=2030880 RepID=A0A2A5CJL3_9GAMM|nr:MAG: hypothetical protein COA71_01695 [SAR86 cluster bacterium]
MTTLIELHDHNIRISSPQGLLGESPGFANIFEKPPVFGADAIGLTRLHPQQSFNQFWFQLGLDPLVNKNKLFRHQADLAFGHLESITKQFELDGETIFAVPSHYTATQLATLLGLVKHCSINAAGLVDLALLAMAKLQEHQHALFMDVQLHQTVLTLVTKEQGEIIREKVLPVPGTGLLSLHDAWTNTITDAFIKQSRFDPLHNADTEQYIYNEMEKWLKAVTVNKEILLEINNKGAIHQANLTLKKFEQRAQSIFNRVSQEIDGITSKLTPIYALERIASLPGLQQTMPNILAVSDNAITENGFQHLDLIKGSGKALKLVSRLPVTQASPAPTQTPATPQPSHFVFQYKAYALPNINLPDLKLSTPITITLQDQGYFLHASSELHLQLNGLTLTEPTLLKLGDCLTVNEHFTLEFIQVQ